MSAFARWTEAPSPQATYLWGATWAGLVRPTGCLFASCRRTVVVCHGAAGGRELHFTSKQQRLQPAARTYRHIVRVCKIDLHGPNPNQALCSRRSFDRRTKRATSSGAAAGSQAPVRQQHTVTPALIRGSCAYPYVALSAPGRPQRTGGFGSAGGGGGSGGGDFDRRPALW